ncbi:hypothetical protein EV360DRAFT_43921 [Lentinula raphanica]|nr:hypothetical protein EV360DRAFT_43921 [Lentinula raphanica]
MAYPSFISDKSTAVRISDSWPTIAGIRKIVIFGDSYSSVGYQGHSGEKAPRALEPLGVDYPGYSPQMWNEPGTPNWVGHLITKYTPEPRYKPDTDEQDEGYQNNPILVYDYAVGGSTIDGVKQQIGLFFLAQNGVGNKPDWAPWTSEETLFVIWVGINDCALSRNHDHAFKTMSDLQEQLYNGGARNFLFIDVPPMARSPAFIPLIDQRKVHSRHIDSEAEHVYHVWNNQLRSSVASLAQEYSDTSVFLFSAHATFNNFLNHPNEYGFTHLDTKKPFGRIWSDHLHPTSKVHDIVAFDMFNFLSKFPRKSV